MAITLVARMHTSDNQRVSSFADGLGLNYNATLPVLGADAFVESKKLGLRCPDCRYVLFWTALMRKSPVRLEDLRSVFAVPPLARKQDARRTIDFAE